MRSRGWSAVSYRDLAAEVGIRSASIHHHYPAKADLGDALIGRYTSTFMDNLHRLDEERGSALDRFSGYLDLVRDALSGGVAMCLCARLVADFELLPEGMRGQISEFMQQNIDWIADTLSLGVTQGVFAPIEDVKSVAWLVYSEVQGVQLLVRGFVDITRFDEVADQLIRRLAPARALDLRAG